MKSICITIKNKIMLISKTKLFKRVRRIFYIFFPFVEYELAKRQIIKIIEETTKIDDLILKKKDLKEQSSLKILKEFYKDSLDAKFKLDDKAKAMTITITIEITLILALSNMMIPLFQNTIVVSYRTLFIIIGSFAIIYMYCAAKYSVQIFLSNLSLYKMDYIENDIRRSYKKCIILNRLTNLIRSNGLYTAYRSLINSLITLIILYLLILYSSLGISFCLW